MPVYALFYTYSGSETIEKRARYTATTGLLRHYYKLLTTKAVQDLLTMEQTTQIKWPLMAKIGNKAGYETI